MAFNNLQNRITSIVRKIQGKAQLSERNMEETLNDIRIALLEADVNYKVVREFLDNVRKEAEGTDVLNTVEPGQMLVKIIHDELLKILGDDSQGINYVKEGLTKVMIVGLQGSGKTTNLAKIAYHAKNTDKKKVLLVALDLQRPAAIEQLKTLGKEIEVEVFSQGTEVDILTQAQNALNYAYNNQFDLLLVDTAGRLQIDEALMKELEDLKKVLSPEEIMLTVDALTGQDIANVARTFNKRLGITGLVVTKFDGDSKGGAILSVKYIADVPVKYVGVGERMKDLDRFYPDRVVDRLIGMGDIVSLVEKAESEMDMERAEDIAKRMMEGEFTLEDFIYQLEQACKMGPIENLMSMIPGLDALAKNAQKVNLQKEAKIERAIINSMTPYERAHPDRLRSSHKRRIIAGSGTKMDDINRLLNQYEKAKKMMGQVRNIADSFKI